MLRGGLIAAFLLSMAPSAHATLGRDDQWSYVPASADHGARAELHGDAPEGVPPVLILRFECQASTHALTALLDYDAHEYQYPFPKLAPFELVIGEGERSFVMRRANEDGHAQRRLILSAEVAAAVAGADEVYLYAANESGDPWRLGRAPALKRLVGECWERTVR